MPRWTLRGMLLFVALAALALVSLQFASDNWLAVVASVAMLMFFVALIVAAVDRGLRQAFAIGFALTIAAYGAIVAGFQGSEFDQWTGRLPTTYLLRHLHDGLDRSVWTPTITVLQSGATGEKVEVLQRMLNAQLKPSPRLDVDGDFGPRTHRAVTQFQSQASLSTTGTVDMKTLKTLGLVFDAKTRSVVIPAYARSRGATWKAAATFREIPPREFFMPIGHSWWAIVFGLFGGWFARLVYLRRIRERDSLAAGRS